MKTGSGTLNVNAREFTPGAATVAATQNGAPAAGAQNGGAADVMWSDVGITDETDSSQDWSQWGYSDQVTIPTLACVVGMWAHHGVSSMFLPVIGALSAKWLVHVNLCSWYVGPCMQHVSACQRGYSDFNKLASASDTATCASACSGVYAPMAIEQHGFLAHLRLHKDKVFSGNDPWKARGASAPPAMLLER